MRLGEHGIKAFMLPIFAVIMVYFTYTMINWQNQISEITRDDLSIETSIFDYDIFKSLQDAYYDRIESLIAKQEALKAEKNISRLGELKGQIFILEEECKQITIEYNQRAKKIHREVLIFNELPASLDIQACEQAI